MKKLFLALITFTLVLTGVNAFAEPFLCCDPYTSDMIQPTRFEVTFNGTDWIIYEPEVLADGSKRLHANLEFLLDGDYSILLKACNQWGCSSTVPFSFTKALPGAPANIFLEF